MKPKVTMATTIATVVEGEARTEAALVRASALKMKLKVKSLLL